MKRFKITAAKLGTGGKVRKSTMRKAGAKKKGTGKRGRPAIKGGRKEKLISAGAYDAKRKSAGFVKKGYSVTRKKVGKFFLNTIHKRGSKKILGKWMAKAPYKGKGHGGGRHRFVSAKARSAEKRGAKKAVRTRKILDRQFKKAKPSAPMVGLGTGGAKKKRATV